MPVSRALPVVFLAALLAGGFARERPRPASDPPATPPFFLPRSGVLFASDFRSGRMDGWQPDRADCWSVKGGALRGALPDRKQLHSLIYAGAVEWTDYAVDLDLCQTRGVDKGVVVRVEKTHGIGVDLRGTGYNDAVMHRDAWPMGRAPARNTAGVWHHLRVEARGDRYRVLVDGALVLDRADPHHARPHGHIALAAYTGGVGACTVYYANVVVTRLE